MEVKIGVQHAPREITVETSATPEQVSRSVSEALASQQALITLEDDRGRKVLVPADKLAYMEIGEPESRRVGFGTL